MSGAGPGPRAFIDSRGNGQLPVKTKRGTFVFRRATAIEALKALGTPRHCLGCGCPLWSRRRQWCRKKTCLRARARAYAHDHRAPSTLVRVVSRLKLNGGGRIRLTLECGCRREVPRSKANRDTVHCRKHRRGLDAGR